MRLASVLATTFRRSLLFVVLLGPLTGLSGQAPARPPAAAPAAKPAEPVVTGVRLAELTWPVAEQRLTPETVVVLPLGAAALQHGLHLRLENDRTLADYFTSRILQLADVVAAPPLPYHYFPAFAEYPGSTSLSLTTARDLTADVVRSLARSGPRRFYVLNTGDSSAQALAAAAKLLASDGILLHYTDWRVHLAATRGMQRQPGGNHADEIETSMMLYIDPSAVNMRSAQPDYNPAVSTPFQLTRREGGRGTYSPTGAWGDPSLATRDKGRVVVEGLVSAIRTDIETLRKASLPIAGPAAATPAPASVRPPQSTLAPHQRGVPARRRSDHPGDRSRVPARVGQPGRRSHRLVLVRGWRHGAPGWPGREQREDHRGKPRLPLQAAGVPPFEALPRLRHHSLHHA